MTKKKLYKNEVKKWPVASQGFVDLISGLLVGGHHCFLLAIVNLRRTTNVSSFPLPPAISAEKVFFQLYSSSLSLNAIRSRPRRIEEPFV